LPDHFGSLQQGRHSCGTGRSTYDYRFGRFKEEIKGKNVICIVSGSNNDITRTAEIKERALLYGKLKHYFIIRFPQRPGALKEFVVDILGPTDDITHFEYSKKSSRENAPAVVGIELKSPEDLAPLIKRMKDNNFLGTTLTINQICFSI
jgi:threonine dehydratase